MIGATVGTLVGVVVVGTSVGDAVGSTVVGVTLGTTVGDKEAILVGNSVVTTIVGSAVARIFAINGSSVGDEVASLGLLAGIPVGISVGVPVGLPVGLPVGRLVGTPVVGLKVGARVGDGVITSGAFAQSTISGSLSLSLPNRRMPPSYLPATSLVVSAPPRRFCLLAPATLPANSTISKKALSKIIVTLFI